MLNNNSVSDLINFIKLNNHGRCKKTGSNGYYQSFCINCGDYERKPNPDHGHLNIMFMELMCKCWRCEHSSSLLQFVLDLGYNNQEVIKELKALKQSGYTYRGTKSNTRSDFDLELNIKMANSYAEFRKKYPNEFKQYLDYINYRCGEINPIKYGFSPLIRENKLLVEFYNSSGFPITARYIDNGDIRYLKYKDSGYYYYQNIKEVVDYKSIVICEGIFDIVNLSNYYLDFKDSFFFAMNSRKYTSILKYLISKYFLLGKYTFNIVFDDDVFNIEDTKRELTKIKNQYNHECVLNFFIPESSKDVSDLMLIERI